MKKILLSTLTLIAFSFSIILFEVSCKKTASADSPTYTLPIATTSKLGGVIPDGSTISVDANGKISTINNIASQQNRILYFTYEGVADANGFDLEKLHSANYDGTNVSDINIILPSGISLDNGPISLSPDHKTIFFEVETGNPNNSGSAIYACNIDGSNPHLINNIKSPEIAIAY